MNKSEIAETLRKIKDLARWDGPDAAPKRMHEIWQIVSTAIENREWERAIAESQGQQPSITVAAEQAGHFTTAVGPMIKQQPHQRTGHANNCLYSQAYGTKCTCELGDGEPSAAPAKCTDPLCLGECGLAEIELNSRSGAAQEVSPPSPGGGGDKFKAALEMIENYDSSCECDDHTQPECCANVAVTDCFCAHCIAGKALL